MSASNLPEYFIINRNDDFGSVSLEKPPVMNIMKTDIMVTNYPDHSPVINFDGEAGINLSTGVRSMKKLIAAKPSLLCEG